LHRKTPSWEPQTSTHLPATKLSIHHVKRCVQTSVHCAVHRIFLRRLVSGYPAVRGESDDRRCSGVAFPRHDCARDDCLGCHLSMVGVKSLLGAISLICDQTESSLLRGIANVVHRAAVTQFGGSDRAIDIASATQTVRRRKVSNLCGICEYFFNVYPPRTLRACSVARTRT
jgi:hypothetical protein